GDGYIVARLMAECGADVSVYSLARPKPGTDAEKAASLWSGDVLSFDDFLPQSNQGLLIDAVFGSGFRGVLPDTVANALARANACGMKKIAVDVPSGLHGDTGLSELGISYDATVTFFRKKPGHISGQGPSVVGQLTVADIGVRADFTGTHAPMIFENTPSLWGNHRPERNRDTHKYRQGHVAVFSGPKYKTGAARLSALAAARSGAGAVTILGSDAALDIHANHVSSIMLKQCSRGGANGALVALNKLRAVVLGPGFDDYEEARSITNICLSPEQKLNLSLVLDADGITAFADLSEELFALSRQKLAPMLVLTPHEGEFARIFPDIAGDQTLGKLQKAQAAAERSNAIIVFKGADTIIAAPASSGNGLAAINTNGSTALATAGSGDVLAGIIAGLMAQNMAPFYAACAAVWMHGEAGKYAGPICIAEDLVDALRYIEVDRVTNL
ncbi:MAG: NAD(P)H-hydrate dehydratase, partial [Pseudomonadota bacterium]